MSWPTMSDYQEAIQNPTNCFLDPTLKLGTPALNALGLPQPITGGFCSVYKVTSGRTGWAVRCFLYDIQDLRDRYAHISRYLRTNRPKHMVGFEYVREGIRVHGAWHPVLKMEWVEGDTLDVWVEKHLHDAQALRKLAERWTEVLKGLEKAHIGHCDLQHGNILVDRSDEFRLIDYDGMYVPPLRGRGSHEKGHPAYQHPEREGEDFDESVDHFPGLAIYTALLGLAEKPEMWERYYVGDNLIFRRADFQSPDSAPVFQELSKLGGATAEHAKALRDACKQRLDKTPRLREIRAGNERPAARPGVLAALKDMLPRSAPKAKPTATKSRAATPKPAASATKTPASKSRAASSPQAAQAATSTATKSRTVSPAPTAAAAKPLATKSRSASGPAKTPPAVARAAAPAPSTNGAKKKSATLAPAATLKLPVPQPGWMTGGTAKQQAVPQIVSVPSVAMPAPHTAPVSAPVAIGAGWAVVWTRPERVSELNMWKVPIYEHRESPRRIAGINLGTRHEKVFERFEDKAAERVVKLDGHRSAVTSLAFTPDARLLVSGSRDGTVRVWDVQHGREACAPLKAGSSVLSMTLVPGRSMVAAALNDRRLVLWDFGHQRQVIHLVTPDRSPLKAVAVSGDGLWVAAGGSRKSFFLWQTDGEAAGSEMWFTSGRVEAIAFTADANGILCGTHKGQLERFDRATGNAQWSIPSGFKRIVALAAPRANGIVGAAANGAVTSWNVTDGSEARSVQPVRSRLASLAISPDGSLLLVGYASGEAYLTEATTQRELAVLGGHPGPVTAVALPAAGKLAATGTKDGSVRLWALR